MTIKVICLGHIKSSIGCETVDLDAEGMTAGKLIESLRSMAKPEQAPGFTRFNTLLVVNGSSAFTAAADDRRLQDGDEVLLLPFSHGG